MQPLLSTDCNRYQAAALTDTDIRGLHIRGNMHSFLVYDEMLLLQHTHLKSQAIRSKPERGGSVHALQCGCENTRMNEAGRAGDGVCNQAEKIRGRRAAEDLWEQTLVI